MTHPRPPARLRTVARAALRATVPLTAALALTLVGSGVAAAHVTAQPGTATQGGYAKVAFRVPSEQPAAGTVKVQVSLPAEHPISSVRTSPLPGWTAELAKEKLANPIESHGRTITEAVRTITWTAQPGIRIGPTEFVEFEVFMGRLPEDTDQLVMPTVQTYEDGTVVAWDQVPAPGADDPERPAPTLTLVPEADSAAAATGGQGGHGGHSQGGGAVAAGPAAAGSAGTDQTARRLGGAGLLVGALGLGLGVGAVLRSRRAGS